MVMVDLDDAQGKAAARDTGSRFHTADVSGAEAWAAIVAAAANGDAGGIDIAVLNAGVTTGETDIALLTDEQYRRIRGANIDGVVFGVRAVAPAIERRGGGAIVATASIRDEHTRHGTRAGGG